jgi:hypothetical protein
MPRFGLAALVVVFAPAVSFAEQAPNLPPSARQLVGEEIVALYDGRTYAFESVTFYGLVTGSVTYDFVSGKNRGSWMLGSRNGAFHGNIRVAGDLFCYREDRKEEHCNRVYLDGGNIYEVRQSGIVDSVKRVRP